LELQRREMGLAPGNSHAMMPAAGMGLGMGFGMGGGGSGGGGMMMGDAPMMKRQPAPLGGLTPLGGAPAAPAGGGGSQFNTASGANVFVL
jgi:hypothetical protein